ncbi:MAG: FKBP-type peptidyl-prolyl cis-trans isomerase [Acidimicrobiia bacterium]
MRSAAAVVAGCVIAVTGACGTSDSATTSTASVVTTTQAPPVCGQGTIKMPPIPAELSQKPDPAVTPKDASATTLKTTDLVVGTGAEVKAGDCLTANYVGVLASSGEQFDASWDKQTPFQFEVGAGNVIPGWDQGIPGMKVGGRRRLAIPAALAYGAQGSPPKIPPNANLVFVVDALDVGLPCTVGQAPLPSPLPDPISQKPEVVVNPGDADADQIQTEDLVVGTGAEVKAGDCLVSNYVRALASDPSKTDSSWDRGQGLRFEVGSDQMIKGWNQGIEGMKVGGRRRVVVPAALAYGSKGLPPDIPPDANLVFVVDATAVQ